jgi:hypothetical protein
MFERWFDEWLKKIESAGHPAGKRVPMSRDASTPDHQKRSTGPFAACRTHVTHCPEDEARK